MLSLLRLGYCVAAFYSVRTGISAFTRIGDEEVPDAKTLAWLTQLIGPKVH
jgi:hypothetical protein